MTTETETVADVVRELSQRGWTSFAQRIAAAHAREEKDAKRWRHARRIFAIDEIETAHNMFIAFGLEGDEAENLKADAAIDAAMEAKL